MSVAFIMPLFTVEGHIFVGCFINCPNFSLKSERGGLVIRNIRSILSFLRTVATPAARKLTGVSSKPDQLFILVFTSVEPVVGYSLQE